MAWEAYAVVFVRTFFGLAIAIPASGYTVSTEISEYREILACGFSNTFNLRLSCDISGEPVN